MRRTRRSALGGADLESLSTAATFSAEAQAGSEVKERAYRAYVVEGNALRAAYLALDIAHEQFWVGRHSMASAWMRKAEQHLKDLPESYAYGFLVLARSELAAMAGNLDEALTLAEQAIEIGDRVSDADLTAFAQTNLGFLKISSGDTEAGFALMEEASIAAVNDELSPVASGITCCRMISACRDLTDYQRATEWIEATESLLQAPVRVRVPRRLPHPPGRGQGDPRRMGHRRAGARSGRPTSSAATTRSRTRRRAITRSGTSGACAATSPAPRTRCARRTRGASPRSRPSRSIRLAQGKTAAALTGINAAVAETDWDRWTRSRLLPAQVEIAVAAGDVSLARAAVDELGALMPDKPAPALEAGRQVALGRVLLAEGDGAAAGQALRSAIRGWREVRAPYEVARARAVLSIGASAGRRRGRRRPRAAGRPRGVPPAGRGG